MLSYPLPASAGYVSKTPNGTQITVRMNQSGELSCEMKSGDNSQAIFVPDSAVCNLIAVYLRAHPEFLHDIQQFGK